MIKICGYVIAKENEVVPAENLENFRGKLWIETQKISFDQKLESEVCTNLSVITAIDSILFCVNRITESCINQRVQENQRFHDMWRSQAKIRVKQEEANDNG